MEESKQNQHRLQTELSYVPSCKSSVNVSIGAVAALLSYLGGDLLLDI